jgi:hypothetical protein
MSVGLIDDDAVVALSGVTACDHEINAATAIPIPIVPVEKNSLNMIESLRVRECCDHEPVAFQDFSIASQN